MPSDTDLNTTSFSPGSANLLSTHPTGAVGLFHTISAQMPPPGPTSLGFSILGNYYVKKEFPAPTLITERFDSNIAISYTPSKWVELFLGTGFLATNDEPPINFVIRQNFNLTFGAKSCIAITPVFNAGLVYWGEKRSSVSAIPGSLSALNHNLIGLATYELNGKYRFHGNLGYQINNNKRLTVSGTDLRVNAILHAYEDHLMPVALGFEYLFKWVSLSLEYSLDYVLGSSSGFAGQPQRITLGSRFFPLPDRAMSLQLGLDYGLSSTATTNVVNEPPYSIFAGLSYLFGVQQHRTHAQQPSTFKEPDFPKEIKKAKPISETPTSKAVESSGKGRISGYVTNIETGDPVKGAKVYMCDDQTNPLITDDAGRYRSQPLTFTSCEIRIEHPDYKTSTETVEVTGDAEQSFDFGLLQEAKEKGSLLIRVKDFEGNPIPATISFPEQPEIQPMQTNEFGQAKITVNPGKYIVAANSPKMELQTNTVDLGSAQKLFVDFSLEPEVTKKAESELTKPVEDEPEVSEIKSLPPVIPAVKISKNQKQIVVSEKIQFEVNKTTLTSDSKQTLDDVAKFLKKHTEIKKLQIGGHTDSTGNADINLKLSQERAMAVKTYLVKQGINPARLEAKGFGQTKPIADNETEEGQSQNRRVEFIIKDKSNPASTKKTR